VIPHAQADPEIRANVQAMREVVRATGGATAAIDALQRTIAVKVASRQR